MHGEIPEGEGVIYTEENSILGGGYLNKQDAESRDIEGDEGEPSDEGAEDDFDTDDTVFYEE